MKYNTDTAKKLLCENNLTCCVTNGEKIYESTKRGVSPLLAWLDEGRDFSGFCAADKVVGKAAAFLYVLLGISEIYAFVISTPAKNVLTEAGIAVYCETEVAGIINRKGDGPCPLEACVMDVKNPEEAPFLIRKRLKELLTNN